MEITINLSDILSTNLLLSHHQAQQSLRLIPLVHPYLVDWICLSLISSFHQILVHLFEDWLPENKREKMVYATDTKSRNLLKGISHEIQHRFKKKKGKMNHTLFSMDCSASAAFLEDRYFCSSSRRCLSTLVKNNAKRSDKQNKLRKQLNIKQRKFLKGKNKQPHNYTKK